MMVAGKGLGCTGEQIPVFLLIIRVTLKGASNIREQSWQPGMILIVTNGLDNNREEFRKSSSGDRKSW